MDLLYIAIFLNYIACGHGKGFLLLYRPKDITFACALSRNLRFDISFGMGMSDTLSLVLRTESERDYQCTIEVVGDPEANIVFVITFANTLQENCMYNPKGFLLVYENICAYLCEFAMENEATTKYFVIPVQQKIKFMFTSNSSINSDMNVGYYQVTLTSARKLVDRKECFPKNETICRIKGIDYCFTSGVVCDGVKNCGVSDWYDERRSECDLEVETLGMAPVLTVFAAICCALLAAGHVLMKCLPPIAKSFFVFNVDEDNRLRVDPNLVPSQDAERYVITKRRYSIIPVSSSSDSDSLDNLQGNKNSEIEIDIINENLKVLNMSGDVCHMVASTVQSKSNIDGSKPKRNTVIEKLKKIRQLARSTQNLLSASVTETNTGKGKNKNANKSEMI